MPFPKTSLAVALSAVALASPPRALAEFAPPDVALQRLIDEALSRNPEVAAAHQLALAARERPVQAGSRPGPMVGVFYQNDGLSPSLGREQMTMLGLSGSQEIPYPGRLSLRRQVAEAEAGLAGLDVERSRLSLVGAVKRAYYGLLLARGLATLALEQRDVWREVQETARARYASAAGGQQELLRAQVEATRLQALHVQHHAEARARLAQLNALLARPVDMPVDTPVETPVSLTAMAGTPVAEDIVAWSESHSPELKAAAMAVGRDERAVALAQLESKPDFSVQGGYIFRGSLPPMWQAGASVALPSRSRARAALAEAQARLAASRARLEDVRVRLRSAVEQRLALIEAAQQIAATYREGLLPQGDTAVQAALVRYASGPGSQLAVLEAVTALLEDRMDHLRVLAAQATEQARLEEASLEAPMGFDSLLTHGRGMSAATGSMAPPPPMNPGTAGTTTTSAGMQMR